MRQYGQLQISDIYKKMILFVDKIVRSLAVMQMLQSDFVDPLALVSSNSHVTSSGGCRALEIGQGVHSSRRSLE